MDSPELIASPRLAPRERAVVIAALAAIIAIAWAHLVRDAGPAGSVPAARAMMENRPRDLVDFLWLFAMWAVMMVAMMLPSATYAAVAKRLSARRLQVAWTAAFVAGYALSWFAFSALAASLQVWLERLAWLSPAMMRASPFLGGALVAAAGVCQLSPAKEACLRHCRSPLQFIAQHWRTGAGGAMRVSALHGAHCGGCCWMLMALLFAGGVMNLAWVAAIAVFVLLEKSALLGTRAGRLVSGR